jgi:hypothetical protein
MNKKILVIGHPRYGTQYTSKLLCDMKIDIPHEKIGNDGTFNWQFSVNDTPYFTEFNYKVSDFIWENTILSMRNPFKAINSISTTETPPYDYEIKNKLDVNEFDKQKYRFNLISDEYPEYTNEEKMVLLEFHRKVALSSHYRRKHIFIDIKKERLYKAAQSFINWYKLIEDNFNIDFSFRIEKDEDKLQDFLINKKIINEKYDINVPKNTNNRSHYFISKKPITKEEWLSLPNNILKELNDICLKYDYPNIYYKIKNYLNE